MVNEQGRPREHSESFGSFEAIFNAADATQIVFQQPVRDRRIVLVALPVIVVLLVLVTLRAVPDSAGDPRQRLTRALEDIAWLGAQRSRIATLRCTAGEDLEAIARRHGVAVASAVESVGMHDGARRLTLNGVAGNAAVALVRELECAGYRLRQIDWVTADDRGAVRGSLTLEGL